MKYNAKQLKSGEWAVFTGRKYFTDTISNTQEEAHLRAIEKSAQYHQMQVWDLEADWYEAQEAAGIDRQCNFGDILA